MRQGEARVSGPEEVITKEIIQSALAAVAEEMFATMRKTAMSSVIYEVLDFGVAVTDADGQLASSGAGIPSFVGMLDPAVKAVIAKHGTEGFEDGDIFITNDPFGGGVSHLNDVALVMPVFFDGTVVAWTANKGHWMDLGGMAPGGNSPDAEELHQEGLVFPEIRVFAGHEPLAGVLDIIAANSRLPEQALGDFWAGVSALRMGARRIVQLCRRYGADSFLSAVQDYLDLGERQVRRAVRRLPQGRYTATDSLDDGRPLQVAIEVDGGAFTVDLRGNPVQDSGPLNASYQATLVTAQAMFKSLVCPQGVANAGTFRPLRVVCDPGSLFAAERPAAVGFYYENKIRVSDLMWKALAPVLPECPGVGHFCSVCATMIGFTDAEGRLHSFIEPEVGGWGATAERDGQNAQFSSSHGHTYNCPVEVNEARNGVQVERYALNSEIGGAGRLRGGKGIDLRYRLMHASGWVTAAYARSQVPPWALAGGRVGSVNRLSIIRRGGKVENCLNASALPLARGDVVRIQTGTGGGYGDPRRRRQAAVLRDLRDGYINAQEALDTYGADPDAVQAALNRYRSSHSAPA